MRYGRPFLAVVGVAIFMFGVIAGIYFIENSANTFDFLRQIPTMQQCIEGGVQDADILELSTRLQYCHQLIYVQSELNEFTIRRLVFQSQHNSDMVLLWMVVFITIAGVLLSGLQLYTSFRMMSDGVIQGGGEAQHTLEVERGKVALRSSVTGLFILIISFAFFYVFVIFVYKIDEMGPQQQMTQQFDDVFGGQIISDEEGSMILDDDAGTPDPAQPPEQ